MDSEKDKQICLKGYKNKLRKQNNSQKRSTELSHDVCKEHIYTYIFTPKSGKNKTSISLTVGHKTVSFVCMLNRK